MDATGIYPTPPAPWQATTLADLLQRQAAGWQVLATIRAYQTYSAWTATAGCSITWQVPVVQYPTVHNVRVIDTVKVSDPSMVQATPLYESSSNEITINQVVPYLLTVQTSIAAVDANPGAFWHDVAGSGNLYISLPTSASPVPTFIKAGFLLYLSPGAPIIAQGVVDAGGNHYWPYLKSVPEIRRGCSSPLFGVLQQGSSKLGIVSASGLLDYAFSLYEWASGDVTILFGGESIPISQYQSFNVGRIEKAHWGDTSITFDILDPTQQLLLNFPQTLFTAADATMKIVFIGGYNIAVSILEASLCVAPTDLEATAATSRIPVGSPKPLLYGRKINLKPVCMAVSPATSGNTGSMWCIAHHPCQYIESVTQGGLVMPNVNGYSGGATGILTWTVSLDNSMILIQAQSGWDGTQQIYVTARGKMNPDGSLMSNPADIVQDIITIEGPGQAYPLDQTILAQSRFAVDPYLVGLYYSTSEGTAPMRVIDALTQITRDTLSYFYLTLNNQYAFRAWWPSVASQQVMDEAWGDFLSISVDEDASGLYATVFGEYGENSLLWQQLYTSVFALTYWYHPPPPLQKGPSNFQYVSVSRPESAAVVQDRTTAKTLKGMMFTDQASAYLATTRFSRFCAEPANTMAVTTKLRLMLWDLFQGFTVAKVRFPQDPNVPMNFEVMETVRNFEGGTLAVKADDCRVIPGQSFWTADCTVSWASMTAAQRQTMGVVCDSSGYGLNTDPTSYSMEKAY